MKIAEIYQSVQGEGELTGTPSLFIRASGCNLRCWFCDTPHTSWAPEGTDLSVEEILSRVDEWDATHVVITGGEPMLFAELIPLVAALRRRRWHVTIETAGTLYLPVECDLMSISPKRANSTPPADQDARWTHRHESTRHQPAVIRRLIGEHHYQLKFVIDTPDDCEDVENYLREIPAISRDRVLLMPQGTDAVALQQVAAWLVPYCEQQGLSYCPRRQIEWYGSLRGT